MAQKYVVVGGAGKGGITVRAGSERDSVQLHEKLATGSLVKRVQLFDGRLEYKLLEGEGPSTGWVSLRLKDKDLLELWRAGMPRPTPPPEPSQLPQLSVQIPAAPLVAASLNGEATKVAPSLEVAPSLDEVDKAKWELAEKLSDEDFEMLRELRRQKRAEKLLIDEQERLAVQQQRQQQLQEQQQEEQQLQLQLRQEQQEEKEKEEEEQRQRRQQQLQPQPQPLPPAPQQQQGEVQGRDKSRFQNLLQNRSQSRQWRYKDGEFMPDPRRSPSRQGDRARSVSQARADNVRISRHRSLSRASGLHREASLASRSTSQGPGREIIKPREEGPPVEHSGIFLPVKQEAEIYNKSTTDRTIILRCEATDESMAIGAHVNTTIQDLKNLVAMIMLVDPKEIFCKRSVIRGKIVMRGEEEAFGEIWVSGVPSFKRVKKQYDHPILVLGAGLGSIQMQIELLLRGRKDIVCMDRLEDFGGFAWIAVANKFTKLQTERGTYHAHYILTGAPVPRQIANQAYKTWPSRDSLIHMMRHAALEWGLYQHTMFKTQIERVQTKKQGYAIQHVPVDDPDGDGGVTLTSGVNAWPGMLHELNEVEFDGEDDFGGYIEYSSFDRVDYRLTTGKRVVLYGHGAFTIENVRTLCEHKIKKLWVLCRVRNLSGTKITSWLVGYSARPLPALCLVEGFQKMYDLVGFDCWAAHSVQADEERKNCQITQKTIFGVTDIYFLACYFQLAEVVVDSVKRLTLNCVQTKTGKKIDCDVFIKAIGTKPTFKVDKQLNIKYILGNWINGDPLQFISLGVKGVQARNFASFSVGPGFAPMTKVGAYFLDYPQDWQIVKEAMPKNKAGELPAYMTGPTYGTTVSLVLQASLPTLSGEMNESNNLKAAKQHQSHPLEEYLAECIREWKAYTAFFRKHNLVDDRPDPPYPYTMEFVHNLMAKAEKIYAGEPVSFFPDAISN